MSVFHQFLRLRFFDNPLAYKLGQWACNLAGLAIVPLAVRALTTHPGSRIDFLLGVGLAILVGLLCAMLGTICRYGAGRIERVAARSRWAEFLGYFGCLGLMIGGIRALPGMELSPVQVTLGLLLICAISLAMLLFGMLTTVMRAPSGEE